MIFFVEFFKYSYCFSEKVQLLKEQYDKAVEGSDETITDSETCSGSVYSNSQYNYESDSDDEQEEISEYKPVISSNILLEKVVGVKSS